MSSEGCDCPRVVLRVVQGLLSYERAPFRFADPSLVGQELAFPETSFRVVQALQRSTSAKESSIESSKVPAHARNSAPEEYKKNMFAEETSLESSKRCAYGPRDQLHRRLLFGHQGRKQ